MRRRAATAGLLTIWLSTVGGCTPALDTIEVLNEANCKNIEQGLHKVDLAEVAALRGSTLLGVTQPAADAAPDLLLLSLSRGAQPTPGYHFELADARLKNRGARINVRWAAPDPEAPLVQITTHPCLVIGLERNGIDQVRVYDQHDALLGELKL